MSEAEYTATTLPWSSSRSTSDPQSTSQMLNHQPFKLSSNAPNLTNGGVRNFPASNRSFNHPYSAKIVFFYKEGDIYFTGIRVPVSKARYRTIESLLDDLNSNISMPFGVRRLTTPRGKTVIKNIDQLQHYGRYVASSFKTSRPLNLSMVEKFKKIRQINRTNGLQLNRRAWFNQKQKKNGGSKLSPKLSDVPITAKQILFVLNGQPSRIYWVALDSLRSRTIESVLEEVSEGLQTTIFKLHTFSGKRIISINDIFSLNEARLLAVPRNERPKICGSNISMHLPPLLPPTKILPPSFNAQTCIAKQTIHSSTRENSIEQSQRSNSNSKTMPLTVMNRMNSINKLQTLSPKSYREIRIESPQYCPGSLLCEKSVEKQGEMNITNDEEKSKTVNERNESERMSGNQNLSAEGNDQSNQSSKNTDLEMLMTEKVLLEKNSGTELEANRRQLMNCTETDEQKIQHICPSFSNRFEHNKNFDAEEVSEVQKAATKIQAVYRGYSVRKKFKDEHKSHTELPKYSQQDDQFKLQTEAAIIIQASWRGHHSRKLLKQQKLAQAMERQVTTTESDFGAVKLLESQTSNCGSNGCPVASDPSSNFDENDMSSTDDSENITYTVSVITGNRWAADTDLDLFIILYGELNKSDKQFLRQDTNEPKFRQNRMDSFHIKSAKLGLLQKIIIGHDHIGYGAGVYIERILVTENIADGRQYLFQCTKWLDSGQVDGKIERILKTTAFCYLTPILYDDIKATSGRWELILHSGKPDGSGATTSNLNIVGYSNDSCSVTSKIYDNRMAKVPSASLVQVDFGDIGNLLKIRIEIDGYGDMPDYYLDYVELRDLDTEEHMVSYVRKWMKIGSDDKNAQPFREFPVFRAAFEPLNIFSYEGKIKLTSRKIPFLDGSIAYTKIFGELGETGLIPINFQNASDSTLEVPFKAEAVSVGRIRNIRIYIKMSNIGDEIYEGMQVLQSIYHKRLGKRSIPVAGDWITDKVTIRESHHAPYRFVLSFNQQTEMEGLPTKMRKKKVSPKKQQHWILSMTIGKESTLVPKVMICSQIDCVEMAIISTTPTDMIINFEKTTNIPIITKVRVSVSGDRKLNHTSSNYKPASSHNMIEILKMKLHDSLNGDEVRFPAVNTILTSESVYEFPAVWPDIPPSSSKFYFSIADVVYIITIKSGESNGHFDVHLTLIGSKGETGFRKLTNGDTDPFQAQKVC
ncbi:unnamed protein product [Thelazia callipaeda]|uniref:Doublecortin domain-containing protein n=1 Tax=Thelazia callipaeda TaxID=103827 RepID=A0A0N5CMU0_THECL|nr:unnamed protein product [Thelazia callipaeda]